MEFNEKVKRMA